MNIRPRYVSSYLFSMKGGGLALRRRLLRRGRRLSGAPGACDAGPGDAGAGAK